jgi:Tol biopolymer transport system component
VLKIQDLPKTSAAHPAVFLENEKFTYITPSPDHKTLAFCVDAHANDWTGLVNLADGQVKQVGLSFEAEAAKPNFSEDGRYLTLEESQSQDRRGLEIFDLEKGTACRLDGRQARDKFLSFAEPWWSPGTDQIYFKVEYNNGYRKSLGLRPKPIANRIGEATPECGKVGYYSVAEFLQKFPDQSHYSELALQKANGN